MLYLQFTQALAASHSKDLEAQAERTRTARRSGSSSLPLTVSRRPARARFTTERHASSPTGVALVVFGGVSRRRWWSP